MKPPEVPPAIRADLFGGSGEVRVHDLLHGGVAPPFAAVLWCTLAPGGSVGRHRQEHFPEVVVGIAGTGNATVDGTPHALDPGDVVHLPLGSILSLSNGSENEPLHYLIVKAQPPAGR